MEKGDEANVMTRGNGVGPLGGMGTESRITRKDS